MSVTRPRVVVILDVPGSDVDQYVYITYDTVCV
jgi:hypothetical protein